jgi:hypothetical protein
VTTCTSPHDHYMHDIIQNYASEWEGVIELIQELLSDTVELVQSYTWVFRHPVTLDKYLWSQIISDN